MSRSLKKPPFVHYKLMKRVEEAKESSKKTVIKTWSRASTITPDFVNLTIAVYNGMKFIPVFITENMVGPNSWGCTAKTSIRDNLSETSVMATFEAGMCQLLSNF